MLIEKQNHLYRTYCSIKKEISSRMAEFKSTWAAGSSRDIFYELVFCILTPGARARWAWDTLQVLKMNNLLSGDDPARIAPYLNRVRFKNNKAKYIVEAAGMFFLNGDRLRRKITEAGDSAGAREFLVRSVKGIGYKEASHFLRNIGFSRDLAILDRHILKNLMRVGVVEQAPTAWSRSTYLNIEQRMKHFSSVVDIPLCHLDFVFWYMETGEVFR